MSRALPVAIIACAVAVSAARAAEFSWEPSGFASSLEQDPLLDVDRSSLAVTHYFEPVDDAAGPYGLATFLDATTRVSAAVDREASRLHVRSLGPALFPDRTTDTDEYSVGGRYVFPMSRWYAGGRYADGDVDESPLRATRTTESHDYGALVGKYFGAATTLELAYALSETRMETSPLCSLPPCLLSFAQEVATEEWSVAAQHVLRGRALTYSLSGRIDDTRAEVTIDLPAPTFRSPPPGTVVGPLPPGPIVGGVVTAFPAVLDLGGFRVYSVAGEIFPTQRVGVRLGYSCWDGDSSIDDAYNVTATWFVTRNVGLAVTLSRQRGEGVLGDESDTTALRVVGRF